MYSIGPIIKSKVQKTSIIESQIIFNNGWIEFL